MSVVQMSQRIEAERKEKKLCEIKELILDGCEATEIEGLSDEYTVLERLSLVNVGLTSLAGLPALPALTKLDASGNPIASGIDVLSKCPNLEIINLSGNKLKAISELAPLASLEHLSSLELNNCVIASIENYRKEVFAILPNLKYLNGLDRNGEEELVEHKDTAEEADKNGDVEAEDEDDEEEDDEEDVDEIGISALQGSKDLDDDEEDYVPGEEEDEIEDEEGDNDEDDSAEDEEDDAVDDEDEVANLSGAGVTGPRRAAKRAADEVDDSDATSTKCHAPDANGDCEAEPTNGTTGVGDEA